MTEGVPQTPSGRIVVLESPDVTACGSQVVRGNSDLDPANIGRRPALPVCRSRRGEQKLTHSGQWHAPVESMGWHHGDGPVPDRI